ncbi:hypothetical protein ACIQ9J_21935 [Streptomyces sp. NPDC094153]|uniref:hypothetical protein n=1 Tax=Streptomyces sp. NPDC094153 TaxID=3366058 RepID=UPI0037F91692
MADEATPVVVSVSAANNPAPVVAASPAIRAEALRGAADRLDRQARNASPAAADVIRADADELRRMADETQPDASTTARVLSARHRSAEADVTRVTDLYEQWVKAGPPPLGTSMSRWWDARLAELHDAIRPRKETAR